jgi:hypothetical protein
LVLSEMVTGAPPSIDLSSYQLERTPRREKYVI